MNVEDRKGIRQDAANHPIVFLVSQCLCDCDWRVRHGH
jgi:hypothetical protein